MNTNRIIFWVSFIIILGLIVWGMIVAMNKPPRTEPLGGTPADVTASDNTKGPADAPITIIEYSDFECPACAAYYPLVARVFAEASSTVRFVYRHFPLYPLPHKNALVAAHAAEAAGVQGKFWEMHDLIFGNQIDWEKKPLVVAQGIFEKYVTELGLDIAKYKQDVVSESIKIKVQAQRDEAVSIGVNSTPSFFINGKKIVNPQGYEAFKKLIDDTIAAGSN